MNNSSATSCQDSDATASNAFSRANIFGLFVTLQICQLTQPYGSLLFRGVGGWLWRCNPVASFVEACIIAWSLRKPLCECARCIKISFNRRGRMWKRGHREDGSLVVPLPWQEDLCNYATALLFLRGVDDESDGALMEKLLDATSLFNEETQSEHGNDGQSFHPTASGSFSKRDDLPPNPRPYDFHPTSLAAIARAKARGDPYWAVEAGYPASVAGNSETSQNPPYTGNKLQAADSHDSPVPVNANSEANQLSELNATSSNVATWSQGSVQPTVTRRSTTELESQPTFTPVTSTTTHSARERTRLLHEAFGSNALAHKEKRIDLVTTAATVLVLAKLLVIHEAPWFMAYALFTISGWTAVQVLLLLLHAREMKEADMLASVQTARTLRSELTRGANSWKWLYFVAHLPLFGFLSYLVAFRFALPSPLQWVGALLTSIAISTSGVLGYVSLLIAACCAIALVLLTIGAPILLVAKLIQLCRGAVSWLEFADLIVQTAIYWILNLAATLLSSWVGFGLMTYGMRSSAELHPEKYGPYTPLFSVEIVNLLINEGFRKMVLGCFAFIILMFLCLIFWVLILQIEQHAADGESKRTWISVGNAAMTLGVFSWYLFTYDETGTCKPAWVEWLG